MYILLVMILYESSKLLWMALLSLDVTLLVVHEVSLHLAARTRGSHISRLTAPKSNSLVTLVFLTTVPPLPPKFPNEISVYSIRYPFFHLLPALISFLDSADRLYSWFVKPVSTPEPYLFSVIYILPNNFRAKTSPPSRDPVSFQGILARQTFKI